MQPENIDWDERTTNIPFRACGGVRINSLVLYNNRLFMIKAAFRIKTDNEHEYRFREYVQLTRILPELDDPNLDSIANAFPNAHESIINDDLAYVDYGRQDKNSADR